ncbi:MAG: glycosyltransferase [Aquabacterium sp.]|nr:glycosyltransferase [Aquabacterium sp.]
MSAATRLSPLEAVRLLRHDVVAALAATADTDTDNEQAFLLWWMLAGRREYPATDVTLSEAQRRWLFEPLAGCPATGGLGMNRLLRALFANRPDLPRAFDLASPVGYWDALGWFYTAGLFELGLADCVDSLTLAALAGPAFTQAPAAQQPSWLMVLLWRRHAKLQAVFDLQLPTGRAGLLAWFTQRGAVQFGLQALVPPPAPPVVPVQTVASGAAPAAGHAQAVPALGVNLIGFAYGELGIGEDLRMAVQACQAAGVPFKVLNINPGQHLRQADRWLARHCTDDIAALPHATNIFCLTGFDTLRVYAEKGTALFDGRHNIGWWPWELPVWPQRWAAAFSVVDEVWAATRFTRAMFAQVTDKPVTLMPLPVCVGRLKPTSRRTLGLPAKRFLFLFVFDFNSYLARKNPQAVIAAFGRAFPASDSGVGLVLKTMNSRPDDPAWTAFQAACAADPRITLIDRTLDRPQVLGLVQACDAYISLHRAEGFGRTLAEAMLLGKPVVATNFSGNTDFLDRNSGYPVRWARVPVAAGDYPFVTSDDGAWWAEPDLADAARQMRAARGAAGSEWALQLPAQVAERFSPAVIGQRMRALLQARCDQALKR